MPQVDIIHVLLLSFCDCVSMGENLEQSKTKYWIRRHTFCPAADVAVAVAVACRKTSFFPALSPQYFFCNRFSCHSSFRRFLYTMQDFEGRKKSAICCSKNQQNLCVGSKNCCIWEQKNKNRRRKQMATVVRQSHTSRNESRGNYGEMENDRCRSISDYLLIHKFMHDWTHVFVHIIYAKLCLCSFIAAAKHTNTHTHKNERKK